MESNSFLPPPNFSFDAKDWPSWKQRFSRYRLLSNLNAKEQEYQITELIYLMGERAEEIHSAFNLSADYAKNLDKVIEAFDNHFIGKRNVVYERTLFRLRSQRPEETIEEFVTVLHRISEHCEYANLREELIRDRLVLGVKDRKLSEKLMLNENLTLAKAVEIARQWEAVMREQQDLNPSTSQVDTTRKVAKQKPKASGHGKDNGRSTSRQTDSAKETDEGKKFTTCFNCGTTKHHYRYRDKCPAKDKVCGKCGKKGHYTNLCRRKNNEVNAISSEETPAREKISFVYALREPSLGSRKSRWKSTVRVNGTAIHFKLDPGSDVTLIPFSLYKRYFSNVQLAPTGGQLMAAANQRLENTGTFVAKQRANTREMKETVYVVHHLEQPLLGVGACEDLQLVKRIDLVINGTTDVNPEREFPKLFEGLGLLEQPYHIKLKEGAKPFSISVPRRVPLPLMPKLKEQLDAMVAQEVIEPVDEPTEWCAPIVLAGKPNGKIRICVDLSRLNLSVEHELHPLPVLEHELAQLNEAKIFSRLDANSGFWQIKLSEESQTLTTFITPFGRYKFKRLPFGISSAPKHFPKRMPAILRGVNGIICHMDDILIFAKRKEEHDETLREVLRRLKNSGITLNKEKCQFGVSNITFLGHYIDENGIKADEKKVKAIAEMKLPTDVHGVQRFMGMKERCEFHLGITTEKKAFEKVKELLASDRVLASFDISKKTMVSADASSYGPGAVLKQEHETNEWRPVAFASRTLTKTEQGYAQIEKEALAITWACERFKDFVVRKTFLIETDHKPLVPIFTTKDLNDLTPRLQRYRMRMLQFSFRIFHTPGKDLITANYLSRQPLPGHLPEDEELQEEVEHFVCSTVLHQSTTDDRLAKIALYQNLEPTLQNVAFYSKNGWPAKCQLSPLERSFYDVRDEIGEENGLLMRGLRVIIPSKIRKDILNRIHLGHQGVTKCRARAKDHVWWPGISHEIQDMVKTCEKCIDNQPLKHEPLIPNDFPERPWQKVGMDLFHYEGSEYLVVVDYFSRFIEVVRLTKLSSEAVVDHCKAIFARHGIVISDNGPQFRPSTTSAFTKFASEVGFRHITSSPKHPQSNDQAEAAVKIVKNLMKNNKDPVLARMEYRARPLANGLSPAELLFGRIIRTVVPCTSSSLTPKTVDQSKLRGEEEQRKMAHKTAFDKRHAATKKAELIAGEKTSAPRSYIVETPVGTYRRNSLLLASSQQQVDPSGTSPDSELPAENEETPGNELSAEEQQQLPAIAPEMKQLSPSPGKVSRVQERESNPQPSANRAGAMSTRLSWTEKYVQDSLVDMAPARAWLIRDTTCKMTSTMINTPLEKLNDQNYRSWKYNTKMMLIERELWKYVTDPTPDEEASRTIFNMKQEKALAMIALTISPSQQIHIMDCTTAREAWDTLEQVYEPKSRSRILQLKKQFISIRFEEQETMTNYLGRLKICSDHLREAGAEMQDQDLAYSMLAGLPESYDGIIMTFSNVEDKEFTSSKVKHVLLAEYERRMARRVNNTNEALQFGTTTRKEDKKKKNFTCYKCGKEGHIARSCRGKAKTPNFQPPRCSTHEIVGSEMLTALSCAIPDNSWVIDSGATHHVCNKREWFTNFQGITSDPILTASGTTRAEGCGDIKFKAYVGKHHVDLKLCNVLYVPNVRRNLLSVSSMENKGKIVNFANRRAQVFDSENRIVAIAHDENGLYVMKGRVILPNAELFNSQKSSQKQTLELWHQRFCHVNNDAIERMAKGELVKGLEISSMDRSLCDDCCVAKSTKEPHKPIRNIRSKRPLELVHTDICGPMPVRSIGGSAYFLTFIDDYSRKITLFCLKHKNEVLKHFDSYLARAERETGHKLKVLRSDNGLEYCNHEFKTRLEQLGIKHELTNTYSPPMNGVAERANRVLLDITRSCLQSAELPQRFWAEAVNTAAYIRNKCYNSALGDKVPDELWSSRKPSVCHLKAFGCLAYSHIPTERRKKLDNRANRCILAGYSSQTKGYRLWCPETQHVIQTKHVKFDESKIGLKWTKVEDEPERYNHIWIEPDNQLEGDIDLKPEAERERNDDTSDQDLVGVNNDDIVQTRPKRIVRNPYGRAGKPKAELHFLDIIEPTTFEQAINSKEAPYWRRAMKDELRSLEDRNTWTLSDLPLGKRPISSRWVFKIKTNSKGDVERFKARLVARGFSQKRNVDFFETYSPVINFSVIRMIFALTINKNWYNRHLDVDNAYLYGELNEEIYMSPPDGSNDEKCEGKVLKLNRPIYGLRQSGLE
ncbi:K02A2.6-like [Cordylochernes scorpioides]|uniref:RNA-directed DNA polymerase n=1 Tax=Cordylochernes scorpioides TaxID=51811 RepID=A0ABY6KKC0_9ARAC|nr:K02A2.6-like [Cordylochernes scorpioides]